MTTSTRDRLTADLSDEQALLVQAWRADALAIMPYLSRILFSLRIVSAPGLRTFAVDDRFRLYIDFDAMAPKGPRFCAEALLHEASHLFQEHARTARDLAVTPQHHKAWNAACFPAGTLLPGNTPIESVATMVRDYDGELVRIESTGGHIEATTEHPFFVRRRRHKKGLHPIVLNEAQWVLAEDVREGDYLCVPRLSEKRADTCIDLSGYVQQGTDSLGRHTFGNRAVKSVPLNPDTAWLIGLYVAEGSSSPAVRFSLGSHEDEIMDRVEKIAASINMSASRTYSKDCGSAEVTLGNVVFGRWLKEHCGPRAHEKHIPDVILHHYDRDIRAAFIQGLVDGDGHTHKRKDSSTTAVKVGTASKSLMHDLVLLLAQDGIGGSTFMMRQREGRIVRGRSLPSGRLYGVEWNPDGCAKTERTLNGRVVTSCSHRWKSDDDGVWYPVKSVSRRGFVGPVFNMETDSHTYITHGFLVHNCDAAINDDLRDAGCSEVAAFGVLPESLGCEDYQTPMHYFRKIMELQQAQQKNTQNQQQSQPSTNPDCPQHGDQNQGNQTDAGQDSGQPETEGDQGDQSGSQSQSGGAQGDQQGAGGSQGGECTCQGNQPEFKGCGSGSGGEAAPCELDPSDDLGGTAPAASEIEKGNINVATAAAIRDYVAKGRGTVPGGLVETADRHLAPSKTPWQQVLRSHVKRALGSKLGSYDTDRARRSRRHHAATIQTATGRKRLVVPGYVQPVPRVLVVRDTSGSMNADDIAAAGREIETIAKQVGVRGDDLLVMDVDAGAHQVVPYKDRKSIEKVAGRGGTDMRVGIEAGCQMRERPTVIVVITDGYTPWPNERPTVPVVAAIVPQSSGGVEAAEGLVDKLPPFIKGVVVEPGDQ
mgnify:CR=1 FL=1